VSSQVMPSTLLPPFATQHPYIDRKEGLLSGIHYMMGRREEGRKEGRVHTLWLSGFSLLAG
jgi:hypothetical protein